MRGRTDEEVAAYRNQRQIHVYGEGVPKPVSTFEEASFPGEQLPGPLCRTLPPLATDWPMGCELSQLCQLSHTAGSSSSNISNPPVRSGLQTPSPLNRCRRLHTCMLRVTTLQTTTTVLRPDNPPVLPQSTCWVR